MANKEQIKELRDQTGLSFMQCKKALEEASGDIEKATLILRKASGKVASKKQDRELGAGTISSYVHNNNQVGVILELNCETDFVARNEEFITLGNNIAMHIAAMNPVFLKTEDITEEDKKNITELLEKEVKEMDKPEDMKEKILEGKLASYFSEQTLLEQPFVKNPNQTVGKLIEEVIQKIGEKIEIGRFKRFAVLEG